MLNNLFLLILHLFFISSGGDASAKRIKICDYAYLNCSDCSGSKDTSICASWKRYDRNTIEEVVNQMRVTVPMEIHDKHNTYPCVIKGKCIAESDSCEYEINKGGYMYLRLARKDTTLTLVSTERTAYFFINK